MGTNTNADMQRDRAAECRWRVWSQRSDGSHRGASPSGEARWAFAQCRVCHDVIRIDGLSVAERDEVLKIHAHHECRWPEIHPEKIVLISCSEGSTAIAWDEFTIAEHAGVEAMARLTSLRSRPDSWAPTIRIVARPPTEQEDHEARSRSDLDRSEYQFARNRWLRDLLAEDLEEQNRTSEFAELDETRRAQFDDLL